MFSVVVVVLRMSECSPLVRGLGLSLDQAEQNEYNLKNKNVQKYEDVLRILRIQDNPKNEGDS